MTSPIRSQDFVVTLTNMAPTISRNFTFLAGDTISFNITLPPSDDSTLIDLHQRSVKRAIEHLQSLIEK